MGLVTATAGRRSKTEIAQVITKKKKIRIKMHWQCCEGNFAHRLPASFDSELLVTFI